MPRQIKERIDPTNAAVRESSPVGSTVAARPSGPQGAPTVFDPGMDIARALSGINPGIQKYLGDRSREQQDDDLQAGRLARYRQDGDQPIAMTREQSPSWQKGYMEMHGRLVGINETTTTKKLFHENKDRWSAEEFDEFLSARRRAVLEGFSDPDASSTLLPQLVSTEDELRREYAAVQVKKAREVEREVTQAEIIKHIADAKEQDTPTAHAGYIALRDAAKQRGVSSAEYAAQYVAALASDQTLTPADLQMLKVKDKDGRSVYESLGPNGAPLKNVIDELEFRAQKRMDDDQKLRQQEYNRGLGNWLGNTLSLTGHPDDTNGPLAIKDPETFVHENTGDGRLFDSPGAASNALKAIYKAQDEQREAIELQQYIASNAVVPTAMRDHKDFKKIVQGKYFDIWRGIDWSNQEDVNARLQTSTRLYETTGVVDPQIKGVLDGAAVAGLVDGPKGKQFSPALAAAMAIRRGQLDATNKGPARALISEDTEALLDLIERGIAAGESPEQAFTSANRVMNVKPDERKQMWAPGARNAAVKDSAEAYRGWFFNNGSGFFPTVMNAEKMGLEVVREAERIVQASNFSISMDDAREIAQERITASSVYDGSGTRVRVPPDVPHESAKRGLPILVEEAKASYKEKYKTDLTNYDVGYTQVNGRPAFYVMSPIGEVLGTPQALDELETKWRKRENVTFEAAEAKIQERREDQPYVEELRQARADLGTGKISPIDYRIKTREINERRTADAEARRKAREDAAKATPTLPTPNVIGQERVAVPQPIGPEMKTNDVAMQFAPTNPAAALTVSGEGFRNVTYRDTGGTRAIGLGYNIDARGGDDVARKDFARAGITDPERQNRILQGKEGITPDEAVRLYEVIKPEYESRARKLVGEDLWTALPPHRRAVLTDLAYQTGTETFKTVWGLMSKGDIKGATEALGKAMKERGSGAQRRMNLRLAMWQGPEYFQQFLKQGV